MKYQIKKAHYLISNAGIDMVDYTVDKIESDIFINDGSNYGCYYPKKETYGQYLVDIVDISVSVDEPSYFDTMRHYIVSRLMGCVKKYKSI